MDSCMMFLTEQHCMLLLEEQNVHITSEVNALQEITIGELDGDMNFGRYLQCAKNYRRANPNWMGVYIASNRDEPKYRGELQAKAFLQLTL